MATLVGPAPFSAKLAEVADLMRASFGADSCLIRLLEGSDLVLAGCNGMPEEYRAPRISTGWGISGEMFASLRPIHIPDVMISPLTSSIASSDPGGYTFVSYAGAPLVVDSWPIGVLGLFFQSPVHSIPPPDLECLETVASALALAVTGDRANSEARARAEALELQARERRELEVELLHAQRLESIGRLAGDVAHNFNNMLTVMIGFTDLAKSDIDTDHPVQNHLDNISAACMRTESLTRQILSFARKEIIAPTPVRLQRLIRGSAQMLVPLLGPRIALDIEIDTAQDTVYIDSGQIEHVLVNLMVNARDAMPDGGRLNLRLLNRQLDSAECAQFGGLEAGSYVCLEISDTGCGMTEEVRKRVFEPFFTTKVQGRGTGLGLASCYAALQENRGGIEVQSSPGRGTTFRIVLPYVVPTADAPLSPRDEPPNTGGSELVLLVDCERAVRDIGIQALQRCGYVVCAAATGREAFETAVAYSGRFSIVITDIVLPDMTGRELMHRVGALYPDCRALFTSGCFESEAMAACRPEDHDFLLRKPFSPEGIARKVRGVLDRQTNR